ncbi:MAG: exopolysaccharide biosynthesis polyprenyl glycosylphosphotransferase [Massilimicrobiota sp.]|uniref:exopolysaccharide biosynthesis polyprenyl glycosylphosphotransferase n=1 Tax=Massilimicrobiota sp. An105 TaxID=1965540 RepID=UPI000B3715DB|nr:exopolysaccharide biosynthesis polyprenyl glycosylphosphotransferase [Massilimicrobiota sp. An105]MEE0778843.1 exopolysaccharide biosynthesis polyprenyl glycosylphosphotransferase [Massilimicrobiota sp.]OUQ80719.1 UDP-phosphate galactose phosphotransferase [Massilimicrobiota sp. An105]
MKENLFAVCLICIEIAFFYLLYYFVNLPLSLYIQLGVLWLIIMFVSKHYKIQSTLVWDEIRSDLKAFIYFVLIAFVFVYPKTYFYWKILGVGFFMSIFAIILNRMIRIVFRKQLSRKTLIIGTGSEAYRVGCIANNNRFALTEVLGFVKIDDSIDEELKKDLRYPIYDYYELNELLDQHVDQVIIALPEASKEEIDVITRHLFDRVRYIKILPQLNFTMTFNSRIDDFDGELLISTSRGRLGIFGKVLKRIIDVCAGLCGCLLLIPLTIYVSKKNKKSGDTDPIFFKQKRIGENGKDIYIYKYRSMVPNAEKVLEELMEKDPVIREEYLTNKKLVNDPRITEVGHFLRKTSLDEFPQFINVLKGDMSLVGPRPYLPREKDDMDIYYHSIIKCKPGITGMWQANGRSDVGFIDRCKLDDYYYKNWSIGLDIIIIYKTIKSVIYGKGAL